MGSKSGGGGSSTNSSGMNVYSQNTSPNPYAYNYMLNTLDRAYQQSQQPYQPYTGQLVAGLTGQQQAATGEIDKLQGYMQPYIDSAAGMVNNAVNSLGSGYGDSINKYMSPYQSQVIDAMKANIGEQNAQQMNDITSKSILSGGMGGDRAGVMRAEMARQQNLASGQTLSNLYNQGYQNAQQMALQNANLNMTGAGQMQNLGSAGLQGNLQQVSALMQSGSMQQQQSQSQLDSAYQQWARAQAYPYANISWMAGLTSGIGPEMGQNTSGWSMNEQNSKSQQNGGGSGIAGGALSGLGLLGKVFGFRDGGRVHAATGASFNTYDPQWKMPDSDPLGYTKGLGSAASTLIPDVPLESHPIRGPSIPLTGPSSGGGEGGGGGGHSGGSAPDLSSLSKLGSLGKKLFSSTDGASPIQLPSASPDASSIGDIFAPATSSGDLGDSGIYRRGGRVHAFRGSRIDDDTYSADLPDASDPIAPVDPRYPETALTPHELAAQGKPADLGDAPDVPLPPARPGGLVTADAPTPPKMPSDVVLARNPSGEANTAVAPMAPPIRSIGDYVAAAAKPFGFNPDYLRAIMKYESGLNPDRWGGKNGNYYGLIQFGPNERDKYGVVPGLTGAYEQAKAATRFLWDRGYRPNMGLADMYSTVLAGSPGHYDARDQNGPISQHLARIAKLLPGGGGTQDAGSGGLGALAYSGDSGGASSPALDAIVKQIRAARQPAPSAAADSGMPQGAISDALLTAGLGMLATHNIGQGGLMGLQAFNNAYANRDATAAERQKLALQQQAMDKGDYELALKIAQEQRASAARDAYVRSVQGSGAPAASTAPATTLPSAVPGQPTNLIQGRSVSPAPTASAAPSDAAANPTSSDDSELANLNAEYMKRLKFLGQNPGIPTDLRQSIKDEMEGLKYQIDRRKEDKDKVQMIDDGTGNKVPVYTAGPNKGQIMKIVGQDGETGRASKLDVTLPTGPEFLNQPAITDAERRKAQAIISGSAPAPWANARGAANPALQRMQDIVLGADPTYDASRFKLRQGFTAPKALNDPGNLVLAGNTAIQHLGEMSDAVEQMKNFQSPLANAAYNKVAHDWGGGREVLDKYNRALARFVSESEKYYKGASPTEGSIKHDLAGLNANMSPTQLRMAIQTEAELLNSKVSALEDQWNTGMGLSGEKIPTQGYQVVRGKAQSALDRINSRYNADQTGTPIAPAASATASPQATAPAQIQDGQTATNPKTGERLVRRNGKWEKL